MIAAKAKNELPACPVETTLTLIGDKWKVLILRDLMPGTKRFGELKKSVGNVSQKVLTAQLRAMEENGLVHREVYAEVPPRVEYSLHCTTFICSSENSTVSTLCSAILAEKMMQSGLSE